MLLCSTLDSCNAVEKGQAQNTRQLTHQSDDYLTQGCVSGFRTGRRIDVMIDCYCYNCYSYYPLIIVITLIDWSLKLNGQQ